MRTNKKKLALGSHINFRRANSIYSMETYKELQLQIAKLEQENARLNDENASLWFLLDELEKSDIAQPKHRALFEKTFDNLRKNAMMIHPEVEEA